MSGSTILTSGLNIAEMLSVGSLSEKKTKNLHSLKERDAEHGANIGYLKRKGPQSCLESKIASDM